MAENKMAQIPFFHEKSIRKLWFNSEWWFSVIDVISFFADSEDPIRYWDKMKIAKETIDLRQLKLTAPDGKKRETDCANTAGIFRIIQSIPSPKAEPFKLWLAKIGKERIDEIENPELGMDRVKSLYEKKGYDKGWIDKRMRGISVRHTLTDEWSQRGIKNPLDFAILTNEIYQGSFDLKVQEYKKHKGLDRENLRDHMTDLELIITMLAEATTTQVSQQKNSKGFSALKNDAKIGGAVAGRTRKDIEKQTGKKIVSTENFLPEIHTKNLNESTK